MKIEIGKNYHGFVNEWIKELEELQTKACYFIHEKTGAKLLFLQNDDNEKGFSITFRTLPEDDCGTPHILEHSVLNGSRKYPVKSPFDELVKGSFKTILNAMTYNDYTVYPIASTNQKDFFNLMDVYLDAVFNPKVLENENIFMQEGWRYQLENEESELQINGVVYNEMKGEYSSASKLLNDLNVKAQNPDNCYKHIYGGDPDSIPDLSYEKFKSFYQKYYHPGNSYIWLYGNLDIDKALEKIDQEYLSCFSSAEMDITIKEQKPFARKLEILHYYPVGKDENIDKKTFISFNYSIDNIRNRDLHFRFALLTDILFKHIGARIKQKVLKSGLAQKLVCKLDMIKQPVFSIIIKKTDQNYKDELKEIIEIELEKVLEEGIPVNKIEAALNRKHIELCEGETGRYPRLIYFMEKTLWGWIYSNEPLLYLKSNDVVKSFTDSMNEHVFDDIIQRYLLDNKHKSTVLLIPKPGLLEENAKAVNQKLKSYKNSLSKSELKKMLLKNIEFNKWQKTLDKPEDLMKIPHLELTDIDKNPAEIKYSVSEYNGSNILETQMKENGIMYLNLKFSAENLNREEWNWLGILIWLFKKMNTKHYKYNEMAELINRNTGGIDFYASAMHSVHPASPDFMGTSFCLRLLYEKIDSIEEILNELFINMLFDDKAIIKQALNEAKSYYSFIFANYGHLISRTYGKSKIDKLTAFIDSSYYLNFYRFFKELMKDFDKNFDRIRDNTVAVYKKLFNSKNKLFSVSAGKNETQKAVTVLKNLIDKLDNGDYSSQITTFNPETIHEAFALPVRVQFAALCCDMKKAGLVYNGSMLLLSHLLASEYLQTKIRVEGGAYGSMIKISDDGILDMVSFRDPNLKKTYQVYKKIPEFLKNLDISDAELVKFKIGALSELDRPVNPDRFLLKATNHFLKGVTYRYEQKIRNELINTTTSDLKNLADSLEKAIKKGVRCTLGSEKKIEEDNHLFDKVLKIFE